MSATICVDKAPVKKIVNRRHSDILIRSSISTYSN